MTTLQKFWQLLTSDQRRATFILLIWMLFGMLLETLGIGLVIPAIAIMTQGDLVTEYPVLVPWLNSIGNPQQDQLVIFGMLILVAVYAFKALFLGFLAWRQMDFIYGMQASLSKRMFTGYLRMPYSFHLQRNSAQLIRNVMSETGVFTHTGLTGGMILLTELFVIFGISVLLFFVTPLGTIIVVSIIGIVGWIFIKFTRRYTLRWGEARQLHEGLRLQHIQQGLGGVKDVKLLGREKNFFTQYEVHNIGSARVGQYQATLQAFPRLLIELLAVIGLSALIITMIGQGIPMDTLLPTIGLFAAAAFRLMPSVNRLLSGIQSVRYSIPVIDTLHSELEHMSTIKPPLNSQSMPFEQEVTLNHVCFSYPSSEALALNDVSLTIAKGTSVGFIGGSGMGKSTLVDIILGLLTPVSGSVKVDGIDIQKSLRNWQNYIGYVPQSIFLTDDTLRRNIAFGLSDEQIDETDVLHSIKAAQLEQLINDSPQGLDTIVGERGIRLSGGQRQRIGIARALYHDPQVLVLDEATSSLDTATESDVMDAVKMLQGDKTIIIVAHRLSTVSQCDRLFTLEKGEVVEEADTFKVLS